MFQVFRSFFSEAAISGALNVTVDATGYIIPCGSTGYAIGTTEPYNGNTDSQFDVNTTAALPINVRLFTPTRFWSITGVSGTGFSAGTLIYQAASGQGSTTGTLLAGIALSGYPTGQGNGGQIEVATTY